MKTAVTLKPAQREEEGDDISEDATSEMQWVGPDSACPGEARAAIAMRHYGTMSIAKKYPKGAKFFRKTMGVHDFVGYTERGFVPWRSTHNGMLGVDKRRLYIPRQRWYRYWIYQDIVRPHPRDRV